MRSDGLAFFDRKQELDLVERQCPPPFQPSAQFVNPHRDWRPLPPEFDGIHISMGEPAQHIAMSHDLDRGTHAIHCGSDKMRDEPGPGHVERSKEDVIAPAVVVHPVEIAAR